MSVSKFRSCLILLLLQVACIKAMNHAIQEELPGDQIRRDIDAVGLMKIGPTKRSFLGGWLPRSEKGNQGWRMRSESYRGKRIDILEYIIRRAKCSTEKKKYNNCAKTISQGCVNICLIKNTKNLIQSALTIDKNMDIRSSKLVSPICEYDCIVFNRKCWPFQESIEKIMNQYLGDFGSILGNCEESFS